jgi:ABC-type multidrug transport system ATPase subunit
VKLRADAAEEAITLEVRRVSHSYGARPVLRDVSIEIRSGEILALVGVNGAGKSTLMHVVAGLRTPTAGEVQVGGLPVGRQNAIMRTQLGYATQDVGLYLRLSVR